MPIAASQSLLKTQIKAALSLGKGANINTTAIQIAAAVASAVPTGFFPIAPTPIPLVPAGLSAGQSLITQAFSLGKGATISATSQALAAGISVIAPTAPPAGISLLQTQISSALSAGKGADIDIIATQLSIAIVQYYTTGGVL